MNMQVRIIVAVLTFSLLMMAMTAAYLEYLNGPFPLSSSPVSTQTSIAGFPSSSQEALSSQEDASSFQEEQPVPESRSAPRAWSGQKPPASREPVQPPQPQSQARESAPSHSSFPEEEEPPAESYSRRSTISWPEPEESSNSRPASSQPASSPASSQPESSLPAASEPVSSEFVSSEPEPPPISSEPVSSEPASSLPASSESASSEAVSSEPESSPSESLPESSEPASSLPVSSEPASSAPEDPLEQEIDLLCQALSLRYELYILILRSPEDDPNGWAEEYAADLQSVRDALDSLERALSRFPERFFQEKVTVYVAGRFVCTEPDMRSCFVSCEGASSLETAHRLAACAVTQFLEEGDYRELADRNPSDFIYGVDSGYNEYYIFSDDNLYNSYFLSAAGQESPEQDVAEILTAVLLEPDRLLPVEPGFAFYDKLSYCCQQFAAWRPELADAPGLRPFLPGAGARTKWKRSV